VKWWWHGEPSAQPYLWIKQFGGGGVLGCSAAVEMGAVWNGDRMRVGSYFLYGVDDVVQDFWDAGWFPFLTPEPRWVSLGPPG
jgi:hypothetical protein